MFARYFSVLILALPVLTAASAIPPAPSGGIPAFPPLLPPSGPSAPGSIPPTPRALNAASDPTVVPPAPPVYTPSVPSPSIPPVDPTPPAYTPPPAPSPSIPAGFTRRDGPSGPSDQCLTGSIQCCDSTAQTSNQLTGAALAIFNVASAFVGPVTGVIGVTCNPVTVIGASGNSCSAQPVCCTNNSFNGVIALGCTPINANV